MQTQAYFDDIQLHILHELKKAEQSIFIAVAWFTDIQIFDSLYSKAKAGVRVELLLTDDKINDKLRDEHEKLRSVGGIVTTVGSKNATTMHNKFCVIDTSTIITGSYNWSKQARRNDENITVISEAIDLANQFIAEFESIKLRQSGKGSAIADYHKLLIRMEALRNVITLEDEDDIQLQIAKLKRLIPDVAGFESELEIINFVESDNYDVASSKIQEYCRTRKQVTVFIAPDTRNLKLELKVLELQVAAMEDEKAEIERILHAFSYRHTIELGEIIRRILKLRAVKLKREAQLNPDKEDEYQEAEQDYDAFTKDCKESQQKPVANISLEEQQELKSLFRACTKICHPDMVSERDKSDASRIFHQLAEANEINDLYTIRTIYEYLKKGLFSFASTTVNDIQLLNQRVARMLIRVADLAQSIRIMKNVEIYKKVTNIDDWNEYFRSTKEKLKEELLALEDSDEQDQPNR